MTDFEKHSLPAFTESVTQNDKVIAGDLGLENQEIEPDYVEAEKVGKNISENVTSTVQVQSDPQLSESQKDSNYLGEREKSNQTECGDKATNHLKKLSGIVVKNGDQPVRLSMNDNILVKSEDGHIRSV